MAVPTGMDWIPRGARRGARVPAVTKSAVASDTAVAPTPNAHCSSVSVVAEAAPILKVSMRTPRMTRLRLLPAAAVAGTWKAKSA